MLEKKKLLIGAAGVALAAAYSAPVDAKVTLMADEPSGWQFSVDGNVNAFYVYSTGKNANLSGGQTARTSTGDNSRIQTGLLPSKFGFGVQGPASNGVQLRGYFGLYPQIQNSNTKTARGAQLDMREIYAAASGDFGELLFGRTLSLFQRNAIVQDMTLFGVGATADNTANGGTTLGRIGFGYVYPDFNGGIRYTTPSMGAATVSVGIFDPSKIKSGGTGAGAEGALTADEADLPRIEGDLNIALSGISEGSNLAISGMYQEAQVQNGVAGGPEVEAHGVHVGGTLVGGPIAFTAHYYNGECLGITLQMDSGAMSGDGHCRDHDGFYVQSTYNYGAGKVGVSWGASYQDKAGNDGGSKDPKDSQEMFTAGIYHNLAPEWLAVAEYSHAEEQWHNMDTGDEDGESDIFSLGMFYLW
jgi:predicted porin